MTVESTVNCQFKISITMIIPTIINIPVTESTTPSVTNFSISEMLLVTRCTRSPQSLHW